MLSPTTVDAHNRGAGGAPRDPGLGAVAVAAGMVASGLLAVSDAAAAKRAAKLIDPPEPNEAMRRTDQPTCHCKRRPIVFRRS
jgi:hypothetical protein